MPGYDGEIKLSVKLTPDEIRKSASDLRSEIERIFETSGDNLDKSFQRTLNQMDKLYNKSQMLEDELQKLATQQVPTESYASMQKELEKAESALEKLYTKREQYEDLGKKVPDALAYQIEMAEDAVARLNRDMETMEKTGKAFTLGSNTEEFAQKSQELADVNNQVRILTTNATKISDKLGSVERAADRAVKKLLGLGGRAITVGINKLKSSLKSLATRFTHTANKAQSMTKKFIMAMIGVRGLFMLFRKLRSAVSEGIKNLQEFDKENNEFAKSMETLKASTSFMKNAFGAAFAPLIQMVIPWLNMAAQAIGNFMNKVGALFAMLGGKSTFIAAKLNVDEYGNAINKAAGAQKKLNAELYGFDTLNRQQDKSSGGGAGSDVADMFEHKDVSSMLSKNIQDFINDIKELWKNKDYFNLGKRIAQGVNQGIYALDDAIKSARPKLVEGAKNLAGGLNGFVDGFDFKGFGTTFADGLNTILATTNAFLSEFKFLELGQGVSDSIVSFFQGTEWDQLGANIALKINALFSFIEGIVSNEELLPSLGTAIHDTIYGFFDTLQPEHIANTVINLIDNVANLLSGTDWYETFNTAFDGLASIVDWVFDLINNIPWAKVGEALGKILMDLVMWVINPTTLLKVLGHVTSWILSLINAIIQFVLSAWTSAFQRVIDKMRDLGFDTIAGFFQGIKDTLDVWIDALKHWFNDMIQAVKDVFGISSPSKVFSDIGGWIIEGLKQGILNMWDKVKNGIYETFDGFTKKVKGIFGISSPSKVFEEYGKFIDMGFAQGIEGEKSAVEFAMDDMMRGVSESATLTPNFNLSRMPIPALATGGVVPPSAYGSGTQTFDLNTMMSKIQTLIDKIDADRDRTLEIHNHLELDGEEIYNNVVEHNNQQIQRSGSSRLIV